jgi:pilus assembly protein Flp/PilA
VLSIFTFIQARLAVLKDERGATAVEYGLIVALIAAIIVATVALVGTDVLNGFETVENNIGGSQN